MPCPTVRAGRSMCDLHIRLCVLNLDLRVVVESVYLKECLSSNVASIINWRMERPSVLVFGIGLHLDCADLRVYVSLTELKTMGEEPRGFEVSCVRPLTTAAGITSMSSSGSA